MSDNSKKQSSARKGSGEPGSKQKIDAESGSAGKKQSAGNQPSPAEDSGDLFETRLEKLEKLRAQGYDPYQKYFKPDSLARNVHDLPEGDIEKQPVFRMAGRIRSKRMMGKAGFMDLVDESGRVQIYGRKDEPGINFDVFKSLDLGDIVGVAGYPFVTKMGERTLHVTELELVSKCLRPLPVVKEADGKVYDAFADKEQRYRQRYVDLIVNPEVRDTFRTRSRIISWIRGFLEKRDFLEVETPMMHVIPGGASARPFQTHHNALDMELFLRIAPELYLKRLLVGGVPRVFEINRNFRNEGISYKHNPEFTMLEVYESYGSMDSMLELCETLITGVTQEIHGSLKIPYGEEEIDLTPPWPRIPYVDAIEKHSGIKVTAATDLSELKEKAKKAGVSEKDLQACDSVWKVAECLFDEKVEANLIQPVFITQFPRELSPLAKANPEDPSVVDRFEPYITGREMGNAFSELNDPLDQRERFQKQVEMREAGDEEAGYMDLDYVRALEYGMPPAGGMGIGIDRLVMLLTNSKSIRDTILFPLMRPEHTEK
ncbi:MAG: lysine--tRNA ligase [Leptospiraceae bacterium]